jgi:hypothetical protein
MRRKLLDGGGARRSRRINTLSNILTELIQLSLDWDRDIICFDEDFGMRKFLMVIA